MSRFLDERGNLERGNFRLKISTTHCDFKRTRSAEEKGRIFFILPPFGSRIDAILGIMSPQTVIDSKLFAQLESEGWSLKTDVSRHL